MTQLNHRWSNNRRSQLLKQHQGELNRVVFSDSRRRPLSCTPPSTSISTSVSIDEDEPPNQIQPQQPQIGLTTKENNNENDSSLSTCHPPLIEPKEIETIEAIEAVEAVEPLEDAEAEYNVRFFSDFPHYSSKTTQVLNFHFEFSALFNG